jgi:hypothetical protein
MAVGAFVDAVVRWRPHDRPVAFRLNLFTVNPYS